MTKEEAAKVVEWMEQENKARAAAHLEPKFAESVMKSSVVENNNSLTIADFLEVMGQYGLSQQSPALTTLKLLLGEDHALVQEYEQLIKDQYSGDPTVISAAAARMQNIMVTPVDTQNMAITKEWVMDRIKEPTYNVEVQAPRHVPTDWGEYYKKFTGEDPEEGFGSNIPVGVGLDMHSGSSDIQSAFRYLYDQIKAAFSSTPETQALGKKIAAAMEKDRTEGVDVGFDPEMNKWISARMDDPVA